MNYDELHQQFRDEMYRSSIAASSMIEREEDKQFQEQLIEVYKTANDKLEKINSSLQKQIDEQKSQIVDEQKEIKRTKKNAWIQFAVSSSIALGGVIIALVALILKVS